MKTFLNISISRNIFAIGGAVLISLAASLQADAQVRGYNLFEEDFIAQTGPSTLTSLTWAATANLELTDSSDATNMDVTTPGGTAFFLTPDPTDPTFSVYQQRFATQSDMESVFPTSGAYTYSISGGTQGSDSGTLTFPTVGTGAGELSYPSVRPSFSNFTAFQGFDSTKDFTFEFSGFTGLSSPSNSSLFFDIYDSSGADVFSSDFLSPSTTGVTVPGGDLDPGTAYSVVLDYSNRQTTDDGGFEDEVNPFVGLDYNTTADFTTAFIPEPKTGWLILAGLGLLAIRGRLPRLS